MFFSKWVTATCSSVSFICEDLNKFMLMDVHVFSTYFIRVIDPCPLYHNASNKHEVPVFYNCGLGLSQSASQQTFIKFLRFIYLFFHSTNIYSMPTICPILFWAREIQQWIQLTIFISSRNLWTSEKRENKQGSK